jgi:tRNA threonylcarbamoyladenosine biosynthesis protein TsaE
MNFEVTLDNIKSVAEELWKQYKQYSVWAIHGEMGSGKTTFIHALCEVLQVKNVVTSPTFAIINEYSSPGAGIVYHMDWYRLKNEEEAMHAGIEDALLSGNLCLIEWPDKASGLLPDNALNIYLETINENRRRLMVVTAASKEECASESETSRDR